MHPRCSLLFLVAFLLFLLASPSFAHTPPLPPNHPGQVPPEPHKHKHPDPHGPHKHDHSDPHGPHKHDHPDPAKPHPDSGAPPGQSESHISKSVKGSYNGSFSMVFAFGDSYTDTGNAQFMGTLSSAFSSSFYGSLTKSGSFSKSGLFEKSGSFSKSGSFEKSGSIGKSGSFEKSGSISSSNRCSNGKLVIDFISEALGLPSPPPFKATSSDFSKGANFAIAGATSLSADFFAKTARNFLTKGLPLGTQAQIEWFNQYRAGACKGKSKSECESQIQNALFWVGEIGLNDYMRAIRSPISIKSIAELSTRDIVGLLEVILQGGAKYIVVQGLPPMGCLPMEVSVCPLKLLSKMKCSIAVNSAITIHNKILWVQIERLRKQYPDRTIIFANFWDAFMNILKNPHKFNFTETSKACCGAPGNNLNFNSNSLCGSAGTSACKDPSKYINWDGIHLTEAMYQKVTDLFLNKGFCQPSFDQMIKKKFGT